MAHSSTVLSQLLKLLPRHEFESLSKQVDGHIKSNALNRWSQFLALGISQLNGRKSLRDIESCLQSQKHLHYHFGMQPVSKSALSRANESRDYVFYARLFQRLYQRCTVVSPKHKLPFENKLFSIDGSLLDVSMKVFPWADYNRKKSAFKLHLGLDHDGLIPSFAHVTLGKKSETEVAKMMAFPRGSVVVFDKGYNSYKWHETLTNQGVYWVTRIRGNAQYDVINTQETDSKNKQILHDLTIKYSSKQRFIPSLKPIRLIHYKDPDTGKVYQFITNHFDWSAQTIADIYKQRWQVELFFKWIKQNLKIKTFLGTSKNAVLTQVFAALCIYLLVAYLKFSTRIRLSMQQICRLLHTNLFAKRNLNALFKKEKIKPDINLQLTLSLARR